MLMFLWQSVNIKPALISLTVLAIILKLYDYELGKLLTLLTYNLNNDEKFI